MLDMKKIIAAASLCLVFSCKQASIQPENIIELKTGEKSVAADGASLAEYKVKIGGNDTLPLSLSAEKRTVTFHLSLGMFDNGSQEIKVVADSRGFASCFVKSDTPGKAILSAEAVNIKATTTVNFTIAYPNSLLLTASQATMAHALNSTMNIKAKLLRDTGNPTNGLPVIFEATDNAGVSKGSFFNQKNSDGSDTARAEFHLLDSNYRGILYLHCKYIKASNDTIKGLNLIFVK